MAIKLPFTRESFNKDMKPKLSGNNLTIEFDNMQSSYSKQAVEISKLISQKLYDKLCDKTASDEDDLNETAHDYMSRALHHFAMYHHLIFLITRIGNDGVTVKKNDDETTVFKYQQDQLENKLITDAWFWMNLLIQFLNDNIDKFPDWQGSDEQKDFADLPVNVTDFLKWVGVSDEYFVLNVRWIIREVWKECVLSRLKEPEKTDDIARAVCYDVMGRACRRLSFFALPEPIRIDYNNEMGKNHAAQSDKRIRERVAGVFESKASAYWAALDIQLIREKNTTLNNKASKEPYPSKGGAQESDKFMLS